MSWQGFWDNQDFTELGWSGGALVLTGMDWAGLDWGDLGWNGLDWAGQDSIRLVCTGLGRTGLRADWGGRSWTGLGRDGLCLTTADWIERDQTWMGLGWTGLDWTGSTDDWKEASEHTAQNAER